MNDPRILLNDPNTTAQQLADIAQQFPQLAAQIGAHPNAYPALQQWAAQTVAAQQSQQPQQQQPQEQPQFGASQEQHQQPQFVAPQEQPQFGAPQGQPQQPQFGAPQQPQQPQQPQFGAPQQPQQPQFGAPQGQPQQPPFGAQQQQFGAPQAQQPYGQQTPNFAQPGFAAAGYGQAQQTGAPAPKRKTGLIVGVAAGLAVILVGGGIAAANMGLFGGTAGGASSPDAAVSGLIKTATNVDPLGALSSIAPSEAETLAGAMQELNKLKGDGDGRSYAEIMGDLQKATKVELKDLKQKEEEIAPDVTRLTLTDWKITVDGDSQKVADLYAELMKSQLTKTLKSQGSSDTEIEKTIKDMRDNMASKMDFPQTQTAADFREKAGRDLSVVTVKENGKWYVSPIMTAADYFYLDGAENNRFNGVSLGKKIVEPAKFDTPEAAASGLLDAIESGSLTKVAAAMPLAERRVLSIYGPLMGDNFGGKVSFTPKNFTSKTEGDRARITIEELGLGKDVTIKGLCITNRYDEKNCLEDIPVLKKLGVGDANVIAVKENGGWLIAPLATVGDVTTIFAKNFVKYYNDGKLEELFGN